MEFSKLYLLQKKRPAWYLYLLAGVLSLFAVSLYLHNLPQKKILRTDKPVRVEIVNLGAFQFGIYWETEKEEEGWVTIKTKDSKILGHYADDRDSSGTRQKRKHHYVLATHLEPSTLYYFSIETNKGVYVDKNGKDFMVKTPNTLTRPSYISPLYGKVTDSNGMVPQQTMILVQNDNVFPLLVYAKESGEWLVSLTSLVSKENGSYVVPDTDAVIKLEMLTEKKRSSVSGVLKQLLTLSETIELGKQYDLLARGTVLSTTSAVTLKEGSLESGISILYPRENSLIPAGKPLIKGKGIKGAEVFAYINSKPQYSFRTVVDTDGFWLVTPQSALDPGNYLLSVSTKDERGGRVSMTRRFIIAKSGEQVLGTATGEPTPIVPSVRPTVSPTPSSAITGSPTASLYPSPTYGVTQVPTAPVYISPTPIPSVSPSPPVSGVSPAYLFGASLLLFVAGGMLIVLF